MDFSYLLKDYDIDLNKLKDLGFILKDDFYNYTLNSKIDNNIDFVILINEKTIIVNAFDKELNEEYIPFNARGKSGIKSDYITKLDEEINGFLESLIDQVFVSNNKTNEIINYIQNKENSFIDQPFEKYKNYFVFKRKDNNKWFGVLMDVSLDKLTKNEKDKEIIVNIVNLKVNENKVETLVDNKKIFNAYHMYKKYWISVLINKETDLDKLSALLDDSFELVRT